MRLYPGTPKEFANETPTTLHLGKFLVDRPEILPSVTTLFEKDITAFSSLLARRNMIAGKIGLAGSPASSRYRIVGNRKVMWNVQGYPERKVRIIGLNNVGFKCDAFPTTPGKNQTVIEVYTDSNWISPRDVIELADNQTQLFNFESKVPEEVEAGVWLYRFKVQTNDPAEYVNPGLLAIGMEMSVLHNQYEEMSETAYEKYTFDEKAYAYMTIQRLKWSVSGSADEYKPNAVWIEHKGAKLWADHAQVEMLKRAALYRERQLLFGKGTVTADDKVLMRTVEGFEVMAGDGLLNQGDGAWRLPYNVLTIKTIESILANISLYSSTWGTEVAVACGRQFYTNFSTLMRTVAGIDPKVVEGTGSSKGINMDYEYFQLGGIKLIPTMIPWLDNPHRASLTGPDGTRNSSHNAIFVSLGDVKTSEPNIELLQLGKRGWLEGEVNGINKGGDMANSVDGRHHHILWETGVANKDINGIAELYREFTV